MFGENYSMQQGWKGAKTRVLQELDSTEIKRIASGRSHSLILTDKGVWVLGKNGYNQIGLGEKIKFVDRPFLLIRETFVVEICCGAFHTMLRNTNGEIWVFGRYVFSNISKSFPPLDLF